MVETASRASRAARLPRLARPPALRSGSSSDPGGASARCRHAIGPNYIGASSGDSGSTVKHLSRFVCLLALFGALVWAESGRRIPWRENVFSSGPKRKESADRSSLQPVAMQIRFARPSDLSPFSARI